MGKEPKKELPLSSSSSISKKTRNTSQTSRKGIPGRTGCRDTDWNSSTVPYNYVIVDDNDNMVFTNGKLFYYSIFRKDVTLYHNITIANAPHLQVSNFQYFLLLNRVNDTTIEYTNFTHVNADNIDNYYERIQQIVKDVYIFYDNLGLIKDGITYIVGIDTPTGPESNDFFSWHVDSFNMGFIQQDQIEPVNSQYTALIYTDSCISTAININSHSYSTVSSQYDYMCINQNYQHSRPLYSFSIQNADTRILIRIQLSKYNGNIQSQHSTSGSIPKPIYIKTIRRRMTITHAIQSFKDGFLPIQTGGYRSRRLKKWSKYKKIYKRKQKKTKKRISL
jgi:hypothetical protein